MSWFGVMPCSKREVPALTVTVAPKMSPSRPITAPKSFIRAAPAALKVLCPEV